MADNIPYDAILSRNTGKELVNGLEPMLPLKKGQFLTFINPNLSYDEALKLGKFKWMSNRFENQKFPIDDPNNKQTQEYQLSVELIQLGYCKDTDEANTKIKAQGYRPLTPREFSSFIGQHPEQGEKWIGVLGTRGRYEFGNPCVAYFRGSGGHWSFRLDWVENYWNDSWWFAVVRES